MQEAKLAERQAIQSSTGREGNVKIHYLCQGQEGPNNYSAFLTDTESWATPRHKHNFDQMKICLRGGTQYGDHIQTPIGAVLYSPEGVSYGPQTRESGTLQFTVQFGGADGQGYVSNAQRRAAMEELKKTGTFKNGIYTYTDVDGRKHNQDSFEACFEKATGRPMVYPKPRYGDMVVMNPDNYVWDEVGNGIAYKWLGTFTEKNTRVGLIRLDAGATLKVGLHQAPEVLFVIKGSVEHGGNTFPLHSAFGLEAMEGVVIKAAEPAELWCLQMPVFKKK